MLLSGGQGYLSAPELELAFVGILLQPLFGSLERLLVFLVQRLRFANSLQQRSPECTKNYYKISGKLITFEDNNFLIYVITS